MAVQLSTGMYSCQQYGDKERCQNDTEKEQGTRVQKPSSVAEMLLRQPQRILGGGGSVWKLFPLV